MDIVGGTLVVHPALGVELLVVVGVDVELRPDTNHEATMHLVDAVEHLLWVGVARGFELVAAPLVLRPVVPVLHNIVDGYLAAAELSQRGE